MIEQGFMVGRRGDLAEAVEFADDEGFDFAEVNMEHGFAHRTIDPARVGDLVSDRGLGLVAHLPYRLDPGSPHEHVREGAARELAAALDASAEMGADRAVFHGVSNAHPDTWDHDDVREWIYETVRRVGAHAEDMGVTPCVENLKTPFFDAGDFPDLFERTDAAGCLDTGHAYVTGQDGADRREGPSNGERGGTTREQDGADQREGPSNGERGGTTREQDGADQREGPSNGERGGTTREQDGADRREGPSNGERGGTTREQDGADQADLIREHGDRIDHVHLNETRTDDQDEHLPVGLGFVDFEAIATAMVETNWTGTCTHELWPYRSEYVAESKRQFDRLLERATE